MSDWRMKAAAPTSTPDVGCETSSTLGCSSTSRPTTNFCRFPPDKLLADGSWPEHFTSNFAMQRSVNDLIFLKIESCRIGPWDRISRQQAVLIERETWHRAAVEALLRHEANAEFTTLTRLEGTDRSAT